MRSKSMDIAIVKAWDFSAWLHERTEDAWTPGTPRELVVQAMFRHAQRVADGTLVLLDEDLAGPALALARPLLEAYLRGMWAMYCADDEEIADFHKTGRPTHWKLTELIEELKEVKSDESDWWRAIDECAEYLNDLTHGGQSHIYAHIGARIGIGATEPRYTDADIQGLIGLGHEARTQIGYEIFRLMDDAQGLAELQAYVDTHFPPSP